VHHGQGSQRQFYSEDKVMYVSIHRYEYGFWWPNLPESDFDNIGDGPGKGYNINIPLNVTGNTDTEYLHAWHQVVLPVSQKFDPQLVLISAGYDPAVGCPEGEQAVSPACFAHMTHSLMSLAGGRVCAVLEGGYFPPSLAEGAALTLRTLLGDPCPLLPSPTLPDVEKHMRDAVKNVQICLAPYWNVFSNLENETPDEKVWKGPENPEEPPYDIMCPTPPRSKEEEKYFVDLVEDMVKRTNLEIPEYISQHFKVVYPQGLGWLEFSDMTSCICVPNNEKAVDLVLENKVRTAEIIGDLDIGLVKLRYLCLSTCILELSNNETTFHFEKEEICVKNELFLQLLLPRLYQIKLDLIICFVEKVDELVDETVRFIVHQLQSLANGKIVIVKNK